VKDRSILQVTNYAAQYAGNFVPSLVCLEKSLAQIGLRQVYVFPESARAYRWAAALEATGHRLLYLPFGLVTETAALTGLAQRENCAIVHTHFNRLDVAAWLAVRCGLGYQHVPQLVWHAHSGGAVARTPLRMLKDSIKLKWMARSVRIVGVSEAVKTELVTRGCPPSRVQVIRNGIDLLRIDGAAQSKEDACSEFGFDPCESLVVAMGWSPFIKGVDILVKAVSYLQASGRVRLVLVGGDRLQAMLGEQFGLRRPDWLTVIAPTEDLPKMYYAADVFVSASRCEGFPYSVAEAVAAGVPVVCTDIPGLAWAREIPSVSFVAPQDSEAMAEEILSTIRWPVAPRQERVKKSAAIVRTRYSADVWAESVKRCYLSSLGEA